MSAGRFIEYERVADYWGKDLPVNVGQGNFDVIRIDFFQERETAFEAFKKGAITYREEFTSITWATGYDFPAHAAGKVRKTLFPAEAVASFQNFFFNTRREKFADPRVRMAIGLAFDFEWSNKNLFFDAYQREFSYFQNSDFMAEGRPDADEMALLGPYQADLPADVFDEVPCAAKDRRFRQRPRHAETSLRSAQGGRLEPEGREARRRARRSARLRISDRRLGVRASAVALGSESQAHRHRRDDPPGRPRRNIRHGSTISIST